MSKDIEKQRVFVLKIKGKGPCHPQERFNWDPNSHGHRGQKQKPGRQGRILALVCQPKRSIVVMMFLLNDHDLGIVIAPAVVMTARPPTMKAAIVIAVFLDNDRSILCVCGYGWQRNCNRTQSCQGDKKCAHVLPPKSALIHRFWKTGGQTRSSKLFSEASFRLEASLRRPPRAMSALGHYGLTVGTFLSAGSLVSNPWRRV